MKLSAAIRIGSMTTKPIAGRLIFGNSACALGAALSALNKSDFVMREGPWMGYKFLRDTFPFLDTYTVDVPGENVMSQIWRWNDYSNYSREEIADRVEQIEWAEEQFEKYGREIKTETKQEVLI